MQCISVFILLITLAIAQKIFSFDIINEDQNEEKFDDIQQTPSSSSSYYSSLSAKKQFDTPEYLSKLQLSNILNRDQRASISRPYFQHWRAARDNARYSAKNSLAFSPRLGKRTNEDENELDNEQDKEEIRGRQPIGKHPILFRYRLG